MSFYKSKVVEISHIPVIVYLETGIESILGTSEDSYLKHLNDAYLIGSLPLKKGQFHIVIFWNDGKDLMLDVWIFSGLDNQWNTNPNIDVVNLRNTKRYYDEGITAGDGLILLADEEKARRKSKSLEKFLSNRATEFLQPYL